MRPWSKCACTSLGWVRPCWRTKASTSCARACILASQASQARGAPRGCSSGQGLARQETVVDEEGLFDGQARVAALQVAGAIVLHAMREDQILGASGRPHRVGLDKAQTRNGALQARGFEQAARDRVAAKLLETGGFERAHIICKVSGSQGSFFRIYRHRLNVTGNCLRLLIKMG